MDAVFKPGHKQSGIATWCKIIIAITGWFALALQLYIMIRNVMANGGSVGVAMVNYFSFFTILTNLLVALRFTFWRSRFFSQPYVKAGITLYIAVVGIVYSLLLRELWQPKGLQLIADMLLHDVIPILAVLYWVIFEPKGLLKWKHAFWWLLYPAAYCVYTLIRGAFTNTYPYPFINVAELGWRQAIINILFLVIAFVLLGLLFVCIDRLLSHRNRKRNFNSF